jgi:competence protein ComEC
MKSWNEIPLFRFLLLFISGILLAVFLPLLSLKSATVSCCVLLPALVTLFTFRRRIEVYKRRWITVALSYAAAFLCGYALTLLNTESNYPTHFRNIENASGFIGYLQEPPVEKSGSYKAIMKVTQVNDGHGWRTATGNCLVYLSKETASAGLKYGDLLLFLKKPVEVAPPSNPSQFDYKRWLRFNKIFDQVFLSGGDWKLLDRRSGYLLSEFSFSLQDKLLKIFSENFITGQEFAVLSALILGYEDDIGQETISAYAASGALHVLSVSGLHVGIIYVALNFFLGFLQYGRRERLLKSAIIILFLWFYALLTGLSPSVLRSATMLSFIVIGNMTRQHTNLCNTLAASAFFLLCLDPFLIMQVGFQLSYTAVLGIILLQPPIQAWWDPPGYVLRQVWSLTAVSLAAQLATFPMGLLYFHQFPVYFLLANLVVIPVSTIIIYGGIFLLAVAWWQPVAGVTGVLLGSLVACMNAVVVAIEHFPLSLVMGVSITVAETLALYISIASLVSFMVSADQRLLVAGVFAAALILATQLIELRRHYAQKQLVVYSIKGKSLLNIIDGDKNFVWADSALFADAHSLSFNVYQYWWDCGLDEKKAAQISDITASDDKIHCYRNFIQYENLRICAVRDSVMLGRFCGTTEVDFLVLSNNVRTKLESLLSHFKFRFLIIDSSNSFSRSSRWMEEARNLGIPAHSVLHNGAFVRNVSRE